MGNELKRREETLRETISRFANKSGYVLPPAGMIFGDQQFESIGSPAFSIGVNLPPIDLHGTPIDGICGLIGLPPIGIINGIVGLIGVWNGLYDIATEKEIEFYIAHEFSHLSENHSLISVPIELIKEVIPNEYREIINSVRYSVVVPMGLDIEAEIVKQKELDADKKAVELIGGDKKTAISAILKLANYNIDATSHYIVIEMGKTSHKITALTIWERIEHINRL